MANSPDPLPSIPTNLNKLHRIYSDSEERNIEKTILYVVFDAENKPRPYLYIDPDGGDVPENRVDCITLAELFKNGLLISIKNSFVLPYDMTIVNLGNDKFYTSVFYCYVTGHFLQLNYAQCSYSCEFQLYGV